MVLVEPVYFADADPAAVRAQALVNTSRLHLREVKWHALSVATNPLRNADLAALRVIQAELTHLEQHPATQPMRWLVLVNVHNSGQSQERVKQMLTMLPQSHFSIYHYDATSEAHPNYLAWRELAWFRDTAQIVHRAHRRGAGCTIEALLDTIGWMLNPPSASECRLAREAACSRGYTHLWKIDSDQDMGLVHEEALRALVAHRAPFICQPAILPYHKWGRGSDRTTLQAYLGGSDTGPRRSNATLQVTGRERLLSAEAQGWLLTHSHARATHPPDDVESTCPIIDVAVLPSLATVLGELDPSHGLPWPSTAFH